jgi:CheY-like chemotaxis protein
VGNSVLWIRNDFRFHDNTALINAINDIKDNENLIFIYHLDPEIIKIETTSYAYFFSSLNSYYESCLKKGLDIYFLYGEILTCFDTLLNEFSNIDKIYYNIIMNLENLKYLSILYVDDDEILRNSTQNILSTLFKNVFVAKDGEEAIKIYDTNNINILMLDIKMKNMTVHQISIFVENKSGTLLRVLDLFKEAGVQLIASTISDTVEYGIYRIICSEPTRACEVLRAAGISASMSEGQFIETISEWKRKAERVEMLEKKEEDRQNAEIEALLNQAILDRRITADVKEDWREMLVSNFESGKKMLAAMSPVKKPVVVKPLGNNSGADMKWEDIKDDPSACEKLMKEDPETYDRIFNEWVTKNRK